jgi:hypothetical protein
MDQLGIVDGASAKGEEEAPMTRRAYLGWRYHRPPFYARVWRYSPIVALGLVLVILFLTAKLVLGVVRRFTG